MHYMVACSYSLQPFTLCQWYLYRTMACFEQNLHNQISSGDSIQSTTFCGNQEVDTTFYSVTHYDITIGNNVARDVHCEIIMGYGIVMGTYDVTMHTDVATTRIYYVLLRPNMIFLFS